MWKRHLMRLWPKWIKAEWPSVKWLPCYRSRRFPRAPSNRVGKPSGIQVCHHTSPCCSSHLPLLLAWHLRGRNVLATQAVLEALEVLVDIPMGHHWADLAQVHRCHGVRLDPEMVSRCWRFYLLTSLTTASPIAMPGSEHSGKPRPPPTLRQRHYDARHHQCIRDWPKLCSRHCRWSSCGRFGPVLF